MTSFSLISFCKQVQAHSSVEFLTKGLLQLKFDLGALLKEAPPSKPIQTFQKASFKEELWRSTCFELFAFSEEDFYYEINISPEGDWTYYKFTSYRANVQKIKNCPIQSLNLDSEKKSFEIQLESFSQELLFKPALIWPKNNNSKELFYLTTEHPPQEADFHLKIGAKKLKNLKT